MGKPVITDEMKAGIFAHREGGWSYGRISRKFGVSEGAIAWHCLREGVESPRTERRVLAANRLTGIEQRGNHVVRRYTAEEDALLLRLSRDGVGDTDIGRACNPPRRPNSIKGRLMTLARHEARKEAAANV